MMIWQARMAASAVRWLSGVTPAQQAAMVLDLTGTATETERAQDALLQTIASLSGEALENAFARYIASGVSSGSLEGNLRAFGAEAAQTVTQLRLYADSFSARETLGAVLRGYAETVTYADAASGLVQPGMALMESAEKTDRLGMVLAGVLAGAFIVLVSALAASARRRELWQLRMLGLSSPQGIVGAESLLLGLFGGVLGAGAAWALCALLGSLGGAALSLIEGALLIFLIVFLAPRLGVTWFADHAAGTHLLAWFLNNTPRSIIASLT